MRTLQSSILIAAVVMTGCNNSTSEPGTTDNRPLVEIEYYNYAWGTVYQGYYIDDTGDVYKYDRKGAQWGKAGDATGTLTDLNDKYAPVRTLQVSRPADVPTITAKIAAVGNDTTPPTSKCADAGVMSYYVYKYSGDRYTRVLLYRAGDVAQKNTSQAALDLVAYIRSLNLMQEYSGCQP